jgi:nucleolar protein 9
MPRENRKRGKKHKKSAEEHHEIVFPDKPAPEEPELDNNGPSWIVPPAAEEEVDREAPFGYVDTDVKAYFRTADLQIRDWQSHEASSSANESDDADPNAGESCSFVLQRKR